MSPRDWSECPACMLREKALIAILRGRLVLVYGKIDKADFLELNEAIEARAKNPPDLDTLREDYYGPGVDSCGFSLTYKARCTTCAFEFKLDVRQPFDQPLEVDDHQGGIDADEWLQEAGYDLRPYLREDQDG